MGCVRGVGWARVFSLTYFQLLYDCTLMLETCSELQYNGIILGVGKTLNG